MKKTTFARWREDLGLTIEESGQLLGLGPHQVCALLRGYDGSGNPAIPLMDTRLLMTAAASAVRLRPWELDDEELDAIRASRRRRATGRNRPGASQVAA